MEIDKNTIIQAAQLCVKKFMDNGYHISAIETLNLTGYGDTEDEADMLLGIVLKDFTDGLFALNDNDKVVAVLDGLKKNALRWDKEWKISGVDFDKDGNPVFLYHSYDTKLLNLMLERFTKLGNLQQIGLIQAELRIRKN